jgi:UDP-N-acetylmuramoyl-tripeptide--D-alanyl-D-alanine ligase
MPDVNITAVQAEPFVAVAYSGVTIQSQLIGLGNNISAALAIGKYFEVENDAIKEALESFSQ